MELVEGQNLADLITPEGLPTARVLDLGVAIADALAAAHERGVVHRDLKPANVMVNREGRVKVLDFGLAKPALGRDQNLDAGADARRTGIRERNVWHGAIHGARADQGRSGGRPDRFVCARYRAL